MYSAHTAATNSIPQPSALSDDSESYSLAAAHPRIRSVIFVVVHIIIGEFVQLVMHVVITVIRKDISGKFVVQTPMQAQQLLSMRILVQ